MPKDDAGPAVRLDGLPETTALSAPVLAVGLGRGSSGKSTVIAEMIWRAQAQGRSPIVADGDARLKTLSRLFADATAPLSEEIADIKLWLTGLLNRAVVNAGERMRRRAGVKMHHGASRQCHASLGFRFD